MAHEKRPKVGERWYPYGYKSTKYQFATISEVEYWGDDMVISYTLRYHDNEEYDGSEKDTFCSWEWFNELYSPIIDEV